MGGEKRRNERKLIKMMIIMIMQRRRNGRPCRVFLGIGGRKGDIWT